ncbi:MAG: VOC family protein [Acidobacteriota bacterium]|nr:VOC family protein [Acidobacteriota bacterium]
MSSHPAPGHIGLNVTSLERSLPFYQRLLGFEVLGQSEEEGRRFAFLGDGTSLRLTLWQQASEGFDGTRAGLHHLAFEVASPEDLDTYRRRLKDLGVEPLHGGVVPHSEGAGSGGLFFLDPDGVRLELSVPHGLESDAQAPAGTAPTCGFF